MTKTLFQGQIKTRGPYQNKTKIFFGKTLLIKDRKIKKLKQKLF